MRGCLFVANFRSFIVANQILDSQIRGGMAQAHNWFLKRLGHWRWFLRYVVIPVLVAKIGYRKTLRRLRLKFGNEKIKVFFVVGQVAKWKCQTIYDLMLKSKDFEPKIVLTICDFEQNLSADRKKLSIEETEAYFVARGMSCVRGYSVETGCNLSLSMLNPDIIFYSQPWEVDFCQYPYAVASRALTFFVPYYVTNLESIAFACDSPFQRTLFEFIALNEAVADAYAHWSKVRAGRFIGLGHPSLDLLQEMVGGTPAEYVIFAPHWSFDHPGNRNSENYSTFLETGWPMLRFAEAHPEIKWVFKPHPTLRHALKASGVWTPVEINEYYMRWEKVGTACYDGTYGDYFRRSRALVTDCGSFLVEYACTGNPLIHLISPRRNVHAVNGLQGLFDTYYQVYNAEELGAVLQTVVIDRKDPKREARMAAIQKAGLVGGRAANRILIHLRELLQIR